MIDLADALSFVTTIHEKAVETANLNDVAKACNFTSSTTTPFYRRMLAARLFKLLTPQKAELTQTALDYIRPDADDAKQKALLTAIMAIPAYEEAIQKFNGKRVNTDIVANGFFNKFKITAACAATCARVFQASLKTAELISTDGIVTAGKQALSETKSSAEGEKNPDTETLTSTLVLDPKTKRKIEIKAPFTITVKELARIRSWLEFQLIVSDSEE